MKWRERVRLAAGILRGGPEAALSSYTYSSPVPRTTATLLAAHRENPPFRAVTDRMATGVAMPGWHVHGIRDRLGKFVRDAEMQAAPPDVRRAMLKAMPAERVVTFPVHPMIAMMRSGNPLIVGIAVMEMTQLYIDICGTAIWMLERHNVMGKSVAYRCWPLPPTWIVSVPTASKGVYEIRFPAGVQEVDSADIVRFHKPDLLYPYELSSGIGASLSNQMDITAFMAQHTASTFQNNTVPPFIGVFEGASDDALKRIQARLIEESQGVKKRGKPFLVNRKADIKELSQKFNDLQLVELGKYNRAEFTQTYCCPPDILGIIENSTRASSSVSDYIHSRWNLVPRLEFIRSTLQERLVPQYDDRLLLEYDNPVNDDNEFHRQVMQQHPYAFSVDEIRKAGGEEPDPSGQGNLHAIPAKWRWGVPGDAIGMAPPPPPGRSDPPGPAIPQQPGS